MSGPAVTRDWTHADSVAKVASVYVLQTSAAAAKRVANMLVDRAKITGTILTKIENEFLVYVYGRWKMER